MKTIILFLLSALPILAAPATNVTQLPATTTVGDTDVFYVVTGAGNSRKVTGATIKSYFSQTPWTNTIDAADNDLSSVNDIRFTATSARFLMWLTNDADTGIYLPDTAAGSGMWLSSDGYSNIVLRGGFMDLRRVQRITLNNGTQYSTNGNALLHDANGNVYSGTAGGAYTGGSNIIITGGSVIAISNNPIILGIQATNTTATSVPITINSSSTNLAFLINQNGNQIFQVLSNGSIYVGGSAIDAPTYLNLNVNGTVKFGAGGSENISYQRISPVSPGLYDLGKEANSWRNLYSFGIISVTNTYTTNDLAGFLALSTLNSNATWIGMSSNTLLAVHRSNNIIRYRDLMVDNTGGSGSGDVSATNNGTAGQIAVNAGTSKMIEFVDSLAELVVTNVNYTVVWGTNSSHTVDLGRGDMAFFTNNGNGTVWITNFCNDTNYGRFAVIDILNAGNFTSVNFSNRLVNSTNPVMFAGYPLHSAPPLCSNSINTLVLWRTRQGIRGSLTTNYHGTAE